MMPHYHTIRQKARNRWNKRKKIHLPLDMQRAANWIKSRPNSNKRTP